MQEQDDDAGSLLNWYRRLLELRARRPELRHGTQRLPCPDEGPVLCVLREAGGQRTLLLANLGDAAAMPTLDTDVAKQEWIALLAGNRAGPVQVGAGVDPVGVTLRESLLDNGATACAATGGGGRWGCGGSRPTTGGLARRAAKFAVRRPRVAP